MLYLNELVEVVENREDLINAIIDALENDGYDSIDNIKKWNLDNIDSFEIKRDGIIIGKADILKIGKDSYCIDKINLSFKIKAKVLSAIVEEEYFCEDGEWFYKKDGDKIGNDIKEVYNDIGYNGCIAYDEDMLILIFDEAENDPYIDIEDDTTFDDIELLIIYQRYCDFCLEE